MSGPCHVEILEDADAFNAAATEAVLTALGEAIAARGRASVAVPGGSTPGPIFDRLAEAELDWAKVSVTLVDERKVDPSSPDSNERLVRERLLKGKAAAARFVPLTPEGIAAIGLPLDLAVLGMGEDGHIASIFPGSPAQTAALEGDGPLVEVPAGEGRAPPQPRVSMALKVINAARRRLLLLPGQAKFDVYERAVRSGDPHLYPVAGVLNAPANLQILISV